MQFHGITNIFTSVTLCSRLILQSDIIKLSKSYAYKICMYKLYQLSIIPTIANGVKCLHFAVFPFNIKDKNYTQC